MNASFLRLGWRTLWRDLRAGELRLLIVAVLLAVAALTAVGFFADRLKGGLQRDARQLLGGDAVLASDNPTPSGLVERARSLGLQTSGTLGFPTMARAGDARDLVTVLADITARDARDSGRITAPLIRAPDAALLDTSELDISSAIQRAISLVETAIARGGQQQA